MKKILFLFLLISHCNLTWAQEKTTNSEEIKTEKTVPFAVIEDVPIFPGCEELEMKERLGCFQEKVNEHIAAHFNYPKEAMKKNIQGRILVMFVISKEGEIVEIQTKGPEGCEILEKEAYRIISKLPKVRPGKLQGQPIRVKYSQPITFKLI